MYKIRYEISYYRESKTKTNFISYAFRFYTIHSYQTSKFIVMKFGAFCLHLLLKFVNISPITLKYRHRDEM